MAKEHKDKCCKVEVQKGPISMQCQFNDKHMRGEKCIREDVEKNEMRRSSQTLTLHKPKV